MPSIFAQISDLLARVRCYSGYFAALIIFLSSRAAIYLAIRFSIDHVPRRQGEGLWDAGTSWYHHLLRWDTGWYLRIFLRGYSYDGNDTVQQTVNFSPLLPLTARLVSLIAFFDAPHAILVVANAAALLAVLLLFKLVKDDYGEEVALTAVAFLSFFPTSFFLSAGYAESLTLLCMLGSLMFMKQGRYTWAAAAAGFALAARPTGIVLLPVLLLNIWQRRDAHYVQLLLRSFVCIVLATAGLWSFFIYQWAAFGYPFGSLTNRAAWLGQPAGTGLLDAILLKPFGSIQLASVQPELAAPWFLVIPALLIIAYCRRMSPSLVLLGLGVLLLPYFAYGGGPMTFYGMPRFALLAFPAFIAAALMCEGRSWLAISLIGISIPLLVIYTALFSQWYWVA